MKIIFDFFKSETLWKQIIGTLIATGLIWIFTVIIGLIKGLDYASSIQWTLDILNVKISLWLLLIFLLVLLILMRMKFSQIHSKIKSWSLSNEEIKKQLDKKVDTYKFERFKDVYDYRRLKSHPWHEQYIDDGVESFITMLEEGINKTDNYKIENGIRGLTIELKEREWFHGSEKNKILKLLESCFVNNENHYKSELIQVVKTTRVL